MMDVALLVVLACGALGFAGGLALGLWRCEWPRRGRSEARSVVGGAAAGRDAIAKDDAIGRAVVDRSAFRQAVYHYVETFTEYELFHLLLFVYKAFERRFGATDASPDGHKDRDLHDAQGKGSEHEARSPGAAETIARGAVDGMGGQG